MCSCHVAQFILFYIPELHFLLNFAVLIFFFLQIGSEGSVLNSSRVIFPFIVEKMEASLNLCLSPLGSEGGDGCPFPAVVMPSLDCRTAYKTHFHFNIAKVGAKNGLFFLTVYSAVFCFWRPGSGARCCAVSFSVCWCLLLPSHVTHSKHISLVQEGNFLFPL